MKNEGCFVPLFFRAELAKSSPILCILSPSIQSPAYAVAPGVLLVRFTCKYKMTPLNFRDANTSVYNDCNYGRLRSIATEFNGVNLHL